MIELTMHRPHSAGLRPSVILLLTPLWVLTTVAILLGLLGIFVLWLAVVGALISAIPTDFARSVVSAILEAF